ncbi:MAG: hypothetical protein JWQ72_2222 [Polaromonas sp.]|nr:hypothetical protein [Polaromonas sp.]
MNTATSAALAAVRAALDNLETTLAPPVVANPIPAPAGFKLTVQADGSLLVTGVDKVTWSLVKNSEAEKWPWYGTLHADVPVPVAGLVIPVQPVTNDTDFVKMVYTAADGTLVGVDGPKSWKAPAKPPASLPPVATAPSTAQAFLDTHKGMGVNYERDRIRRMKLDKAYFINQRGIGVTHGRFFPPMRWNVNMGWSGIIPDTQIDDWLSRVGFAIEAGLPAYVDMFDVMTAGELASNWATCRDYITRFAKRIAARGWTPLQVAVGAFNELDGGVNADFNQYRTEAHTLIRAQLPMHTIVHGGAYWNAMVGWEGGNWAQPADDNVIGSIHCYTGPGTENWAARAAQFKAMGAKLRGMPFILGELGDDFQHMNFDQHSGRWIELFKDVATNAPALRPMPWAMSGEGGDFRLNRGADDPLLQPSIETCIKECSALIKSKLG